MPVFDLFSKRQDRNRKGDITDVFTYDILTAELRIQLSYMISETLGDEDDFRRNQHPNQVYSAIVKALRKEYGVTALCVGRGYYSHFSSYQELHNFLIKEFNVERCLDAVELCYWYASEYATEPSYLPQYRYDNCSERVDECIAELNARFKEAGCGYEFVGHEIIRIDSGLIHAEAVIPAIHFLNFDGFGAARNEFLGAFEHYRHGRHKESLVDALKSLESTIKVICKANGWTYQGTDTANKLIQILIDNNFLPSYNQAHLSAIQSTLSSGIPTLRNKLGGHGDGPEIITVPSEVVAYGLHLTASAIVMLATVQQNRKSL